ncbi:uncharacterized protein LOC128887306 [Hylaeus anthracinus]|uniref:uncharacterized protein LOC128887306 n=1 Tax=Hylaeus anthracinus TaxID=313031 RepID=UPI0023BA2390|nr:uncharacterized protein LOC128887306 [Hylaeus anthracinus]XP_053999028.1 uncharacterized protein LOC128887306 [Hylaeus anthracinus]XP_053999029.1 uncharacterized protein LOC128887306 [Hylaeus anthracinus]XP_053999030.1 uncharacterized protein LOC128887306 [Hylaeus anthracinus]XP_053999031.1 uncharacterized protein LOC128887306 [Hylaeus anthracinus]
MSSAVCVLEGASTSMLANLFDADDEERGVFATLRSKGRFSGTTWGCVGVASKASVGGEEEITITDRQRLKRAGSATCGRRRRRRRASRESVGAGAVGDVRLAPASRLG